MKLSILIPSTHNRDSMLYELIDNLYNQIDEGKLKDEIEIITDIDNFELSVGFKRQRLIEKAKGEYLCFIDSDDLVSKDYIELVYLAITKSPDVVSFNGYMTTDDKSRDNFKIMKDLPYITITDVHGNKEHLRFNNHLSPIKREIALKIGYKDLRFAEDYDYAKRLKESFLIKTEYYINSELYHYRYKTKKDE